MYGWVQDKGLPSQVLAQQKAIQTTPCCSIWLLFSGGLGGLKEPSCCMDPGQPSPPPPRPQQARCGGALTVVEGSFPPLCQSLDNCSKKLHHAGVRGMGNEASLPYGPSPAPTKTQACTFEGGDLSGREALSPHPTFWLCREGTEPFLSPLCYSPGMGPGNRDQGVGLGLCSPTADEHQPRLAS